MSRTTTSICRFLQIRHHDLRRYEITEWSDVDERSGGRMGIHLTSSGGTVRPGSYGLLTLYGEHTLGHGVRFERMVLRGTAHMRGGTAGEIDCDAGNIVCAGEMRAKSLRGQGRLRVSGDAHCGVLDFVGDVDVDGTVRCSGDVRLVGTLNAHTVSACDLGIEGTVHADRITGRRVTIAPFESTLLARHGITRYTDPSVVETVDGSTVRVSGLRCQRLCGTVVEVGAECDVEHIIYREDCHIASSASVSRMSKEWSEESRPRRRA